MRSVLRSASVLWCLIALFSLLFVVFVLVFHNSATTYFYIVLLCIIYKNTAYYGGIFYIYSTKIGHLFLIKLLCFCVFCVIIIVSKGVHPNGGKEAHGGGKITIKTR